MQLSAIILQLAGAVVLLLFSTRMVRTGIERAAGPSLREILLSSRRNVLMNVITGIFVAIFLQSSTAVALLVSGFAGTGLLGVSGALAIVLGADLGTAIVVQFLSFNLSWFIPALLVVGGILFLRVKTRAPKQMGRVLIGIAFILLSLQMIGEATQPLRDSSSLPAVVNYLSTDVITALIGGALMAFLFHSSVAAILLLAAFSAGGMLPIDAGLPLVLGANVGGGLVAVWLTRVSHAKARRITMCNFAFRLIASLAALVLILSVEIPFGEIGDTPARQLVNFHLIFNAALIVISIPFVSMFAKQSKKLIFDEVEQDNPSIIPGSTLDRGVLKYPELAHASVTRELLRMSGLVEVMAAPIMDFFITSNPERLERIRKMDEDVNKTHTDIKLYIAHLNQGDLTVEEAERGIELTSYAGNLERVGDLIAKDLLILTTQMHKKGLKFSDDGWEELTSLHSRVMASMQLALNVLISEDLDSAKQLIEEKSKIRKLERQSHDRHLARLGSGTPESIATSDIHLETVRALREINSRYASFAYPILDKNGVLLDTRLANDGANTLD